MLRNHKTLPLLSAVWQHLRKWREETEVSTRNVSQCEKQCENILRAVYTKNRRYEHNAERGSKKEKRKPIGKVLVLRMKGDTSVVTPSNFANRSNSGTLKKEEINQAKTKTVNKWRDQNRNKEFGRKTLTHTEWPVLFYALQKEKARQEWIKPP
mgnify:CR=1 FL=1